MIFLYLISTVAVLFLLYYLYRQDRRRNKRLQRVYFEDALKYIFHRNEKGLPASVDSLKGVLSLSRNRIYHVLNTLQDNGSVKLDAQGIYLTDAGHEMVLGIIRAHRLWETYLEHETDLPMHEIHRQADRMEHELSGDRIEALNAHLGFPSVDPHGDPIPSSAGVISESEAVALSEWPQDSEALISHIEDEPYKISKKLFRLGLRPGQQIMLTQKGGGQYEIEAEGETHRLNAFEAMNIQVVKPPKGKKEKKKTLLELAKNESAVVVDLSPEIQGLARRRLLDLGVTPGAKISKALISSFGGDPTAYHIRGAKIALRREQARKIYIEPLNAEVSVNAK